MKRIGKWLRKWLYLILLTGMGIAYLGLVDDWQAYAGPLLQIKGWYDDFGLGSGDAIGTWMAWVTGDVPTRGQGAFGGEDPDDPDPETRGSDAPDGIGCGNQDGENGASSEGEDGGAWENDSSQGSGAEDGEGGALLDGDGEAFDGNVPEEGTETGEPVFMAVEDDYFADALFIGDSRTVGLFKYGGWEEVATFYASTGLTVYKVFDSEIASVPGQQKKVTVEEALQQNTFAKIYLMIGINEMGIGNADSFLKKYYEVVVHLQELQPDATIYLQGIMKVTTERSAKGDYISNLGIDVRNVGIAALADNERTFYLDVNPALCDETGGLNPAYTFDGVHLKAKYYEIWKEFLKTHAISS